MSHQRRNCPVLGCQGRRLDRGPLCASHEDLYRTELSRQLALSYQEWIRTENWRRNRWGVAS